MNPKMQIRNPRWLPLAGAAVLLAACSGGGGTAGSVKGTSGDFVVLSTTPTDNGVLYLNEPIRIDFSNPVDLTSADLNTVSFQVFDLNGNALNERPAGTFSLGTLGTDATPGRQLVFTPRFPTNNTYTDGGFKPGRVYLVQLVGGDARNGTTLRDSAGRGLADARSFRITTPDGTTPSQLFTDTKIGGPRMTSLEVTPRDANGVALNRFGFDPVEVRIAFDQPLNPADTNVPVNVDADPLKRDISKRGRIFLEYEEPGLPPIWIPATVDLESNTRAGSLVVLRPIGVLPNNAEVHVIVENTVEDMRGESNASDAAYNRRVGSFRTSNSFPPQYDGLLENFDEESSIDDEAAFLEPQAIHKNGKISASFSFSGGEDRLTYRPTQREVILDTNFTQITPESSTPINVTGGVFSFARVEISEGVLVKGAGTNPMVRLVTGDFIVNGTLQVDGGPGARVDTLNSANFPTPGGIGVCGGGNGGRGSPNASDRSLLGEAGYGPGQKAAGGGEPGRLSCQSNCQRASAGGGGSFLTEGDPAYPLNRATITNWPQIDGDGGPGCLNKSLPGGAPGPRPFADTRNDNDFWGVGVNVARSIRITGELLAPVGGSGGGGGGDLAPRCNTGDTGFISDNKGGGGGGGAGVLIVQALGTIRIGPRGLISANGGNGGGGEQAGSNNQGGGGGAGSGGMVVLMAGNGFEIYVHGNELATPPRSTYGEQEFTFAIAADGGIGTQGRFGGLEIVNKYPFGTNAWNQYPTGGFGGSGLVQMMCPPGDDQADQTGNRLDDNVRFVYLDAQGIKQEVSAARKKLLLGWRGWPVEGGTRIDDNGQVVTLPNNGNGEGDIRPSPVMLPSPFGAVSRLRSRWIDLGFAVREQTSTTPAPDEPRRVVANPGEEPKPDFGDSVLGFAGTSRRSADTGYITYADVNGRQTVPPVEIEGRMLHDVDSVVTGVTVEGDPAYQIALVAGQTLGTTDDRYAHYRVDAFDANGNAVRDGDGNVVDYRILKHTGRFVYVEPGASPPATEIKQIRVIAKFFAVSTDGQSGLGGQVRALSPTEQVPIANVRIGFAFHTNPSEGFGANRWPSGLGSNEELFEFDLRNPAFLSWLDTHRPSYVQWDVLFNTRYDPYLPANNSGEPLTSEVPIQSLDYIILPYRF